MRYLALRDNAAVTDDELAKALSETAPLDPDTNAGVTAMFPLAERLEKEPPRSPIARRIGSACGLTLPTLVAHSSASPMR
jgi:hypothetical protein